MAPDLNSLPPSTEEPRATGRTGLQGGEAPRDSSTSHVGSSSNSPTAGQDAQPARRSPRPRGAMRINLHDPALPLGSSDPDPRRHSPHLYRTASGARREGLTGSGFSSPRSPISGAFTQGDPHHQRAPSLGELHQELEQEQEAQVNRLLQMIRRQQAQLEQLQSQNPTGGSAGDAGTSSAAVMDDPLATPPMPALRQVSSGPRTTTHASSPHSVRSRSRRSSQASPVLASTPSDLAAGSGGRDDAAFYATETQSLSRENRMLRVRIRELEQCVREMDARERGETVVNSADSPSEAAATGLERKDEDVRAEPPAISTSGSSV